MRIIRPLYMQVLFAVLLGCGFGLVWPRLGIALSPIAQGFVALISMMISPIIFCTIVVGFGSMRSLGKVGWVGAKALLYFEALTTVALVLGLVVVNLVRPGAGIHATPASFDLAVVEGYAGKAKALTPTSYLLGIIPKTLPSALTSGEILQVLLVALLFGAALVGLGERGRPVTRALQLVSEVLMRMVGLIVRLSPLAVFAAMAFVVAKFGLSSLGHLGSLMACVVVTMMLFVAGVLGPVLLLNRLNLWRLCVFLREELLLVLGTSSSETALPGLMAKMETLGCSKAVVGLVVPAGYSFNLDGTCIYLTMAAVFIGQATDTHLSLGQQLVMLGILLLTSKGAAAVTGGGFVTLAATLSANPTVPLGGLSLIVGIDRFMSQARALTNLIGNAVAVITVAGWEGELDREKARRMLAR